MTPNGTLTRAEVRLMIIEELRDTNKKIDRLIWAVMTTALAVISGIVVELTKR